MNDALWLLGRGTWLAFDRGHPGGGGGGGPAGRGCLLGRWGAWGWPDDEEVRGRPPAPGAAALGLAVVVVCVLLYWFIAR